MNLSTNVRALRLRKIGHWHQWCNYIFSTDITRESDETEMGKWRNCAYTLLLLSTQAENTCDRDCQMQRVHRKKNYSAETKATVTKCDSLRIQLARSGWTTTFAHWLNTLRWRHQGARGRAPGDMRQRLERTSCRDHLQSGIVRAGELYSLNKNLIFTFLPTVLQLIYLL